MSEEEEKEETAEEAPQEAAEETPEPEATPEETPEADTAGDGGEPPAEEAPEAEEASDEEASADDGGDQGADSDAPPAAAGDGGSAEDEGAGWKAERRLEKSRQPSEARPQRSPEERQAERDEARGRLSRQRRSRREKDRQKHEAGTGSVAAERTRTGKPKERQGKVVSNRADKTITVQIDTARRHPVYEKIVRKTHRIHAHDERNEAGEGGVVRVVETRKLSRTKHWRLVEIVEKAR